MSLLFIGIDNGVTGSIGLLGTDGFENFVPMFTINEVDYQESGKRITRIDTKTLYKYLKQYKDDKNITIKAVIEKPMLNPQKWQASYSAIRAVEATIIVLEWLDIPRDFISVFEWRKEFLPGFKMPTRKKKNKDGSLFEPSSKDKGTTAAEAKALSLEVAYQKWPNLWETIKQHGDADGLFIARAAMKYYTKE